MNIIESFQNEMKKYNISAYIIPTSDYHQSEYVADYFKARAFLSGFSGSAGTLVITTTETLLWTDGRYFLQAEKELKDTHIKLMRQGEKNVPTIIEYLSQKLENNATLGFDGKTVASSFIEELEAATTKKFNYETNVDIISSLWPDRPQLPTDPIYILDELFTGESYKAKLERVLDKLNEYQGDYHLISSLNDIAYLFNLRGNDVLYTPVFLAYTLISKNEVILFIDKNKLIYDVKDYLKNNDIKVLDYADIYDYLLTIKDKKFVVDKANTNYQLVHNILENNNIIDKTTITTLMKAIKNEGEIKNTKLAHIKDGIAFTKFMYYMKKGVHSNLTEIDASNYILECRKEHQGFIEPSFNTICAYEKNASMLHYAPNKENNTKILPEHFLLIDSGGHYLEGTTDITRTIAMGPLTEKEKRYYTIVLKSLIALSRVVFKKGCNGTNLDILARGPIWNELIDYRCGTGHGVGHVLSVHEGPNNLRTPEGKNKPAVFEVGMITTNEPGIYLDNELGIRLENEMLCIPKGKSEFGEFLGFETITYAPFDLDAIDTNLLTFEEKLWLNDYHTMVYNKLKDAFKDKELEWLKEITRNI